MRDDLWLNTIKNQLPNHLRHYNCIDIGSYDTLLSIFCNLYVADQITILKHLCELHTKGAIEKLLIKALASPHEYIRYIAAKTVVDKDYNFSGYYIQIIESFRKSTSKPPLKDFSSEKYHLIKQIWQDKSELVRYSLYEDVRLDNEIDFLESYYSFPHEILLRFVRTTGIEEYLQKVIKKVTQTHEESSHIWDKIYELLESYASQESFDGWSLEKSLDESLSSSPMSSVSKWKRKEALLTIIELLPENSGGAGVLENFFKRIPLDFEEDRFRLLCELKQKKLLYRHNLSYRDQKYRKEIIFDNKKDPGLRSAALSNYRFSPIDLCKYFAKWREWKDNETWYIGENKYANVFPINDIKHVLSWNSPLWAREMVKSEFYDHCVSAEEAHDYIDYKRSKKQNMELEYAQLFMTRLANKIISPNNSSEDKIFEDYKSDITKKANELLTGSLHFLKGSIITEDRYKTLDNFINKAQYLDLSFFKRQEIESYVFDDYMEGYGFEGHYQEELFEKWVQEYKIYTIKKYDYLRRIESNYIDFFYEILENIYKNRHIIFRIIYILIAFKLLSEFYNCFF